MKDFGEEYVRGYSVSNRAYYAGKHETDAIVLGVYHECDGTIAEFSIVWEKLMGSTFLQLRAFSDSWKVLPNFSDAIEALSTVSEEITVDELILVLQSLGLKDLTKYENPNKP